MNAADSTASRPPFYLTTAIAYPNGVPHIGHAYEYISSDALARFKRLDGFDVFFMTGTDEHGLKMQQTAAKEGIDVRELAARNSDVFEAMDKTLEHLLRPVHPHHGRRPRRRQQGDLAEDARQRRHLPRQVLGLVLGPRRGVLHRGRDHAAGRRLTLSSTETGTPVEWTRGVELLLPAVRRTRTSCSRCTRSTPNSSRPRPGATRSSASSRAD